MKPTIDWQKGNGLVPAIVQEATTGRVLMLAYMNAESLELTLKTKKVTFYSRARKALWTKGETSGHHLDFVSYQVDCDNDTLLIHARPNGPVCHTGTDTCFADYDFAAAPGIGFLHTLTQVIEQRFSQPQTEKSYVAKLINEGTDRMMQKVGEEAVETVIAAKNSDRAAFEGEAADLLFHLMILLRAKNSSLADLARVLKERHR